ncbi:MAG: CBS domain-containing protein [Desulfobacterium sp.]|jgi:hypothetical protein|nr:CBS domain-containing protein [Desulfobacterium sp.]
MDKIKISELMRPIDVFPAIPSDATFMDGVVALEEANEQFKTGNAPERIVLVHDMKEKIIGKLSPMDIVQGLEPRYVEIDDFKSSQYSQMIRTSLLSMKDQFRLWHRPLGELCEKANTIKIHDFIKMPTPDHMVMIDDNVDVAFHLFVVRRHGSLFVIDGQNIVGLILFSDVYRKIRKIMKNCPVST